MNAMKAPEVPTSWPVIAAIGFNLIPVFGAAFWGWSAFALIFLYWLENLAIGGRTLLSMGANAISNGMLTGFAALFFGGFFTLHYGLFCFVHGTFVVALFGGEAGGDTMGELSGAAANLFAQQPQLYLGLLSIIAWQVVQFVRFIASGEVKRTNPMALMAQPYPRIIILHLTIIFGGFLLMALNEPVAGLVVMALVKTGFDVAEATGKGLRFGAPKTEGETPPPDPARGRPVSIRPRRR